ncbi:hypothetical protein E4U42_003656 [Claviceps africana]|uniref:Uncharacterized protein n=1 Tax=Claviceps africana TaxID=83212 RepID=A0A8K0J6E3_9HYPO|nr:hypothetical protein E4U42_003656 [Claviceps africana]
MPWKAALRSGLFVAHAESISEALATVVLCRASPREVAAASFLALAALLTSASASAIPGRRPQSRPNPAPVSPANIFARGSTVIYSDHWAGAVKESTGISHVEGTIRVPKVTGGQGAGAAAWVGIDGNVCPEALLQTGVTSYADGTFEGWIEWWPKLSEPFEGFEIKAGDEIKMSVDAISSTSGKATLENSVSKTITNAPAKLCFKTAEWIVEAFSDSQGNLQKLSNFESVAFTDTVAHSDEGVIGVEGADVYLIKSKNQQKASTACDLQKAGVTCDYVAQ